MIQRDVIQCGLCRVISGAKVKAAFAHFGGLVDLATAKHCKMRIAVILTMEFDGIFVYNV